MEIILSINGGMGKSVMATAVCEAIKKQYPECTLIVLTGYPEVFSGINSVDYAFDQTQESYFYSKYIENKDFLLFAQEPYLDTYHVKGKEHVIETWCRINNIDYNGEMPIISLNERERTFYGIKYHSDKPIMVIQSNGGGAQQEMKYSWARDIPRSITQSVIDHYKNDYKIFHIRRDNQLSFEGVTPVSDTYKGLACLISKSQKRLFLDSVGQHIAASLNLKSTVLWIVNKPNQFGYLVHDNIIANPETVKPDLRFSSFTRHNITGALHEFPYNSENEIFNIEQIIESINQQ